MGKDYEAHSAGIAPEHFDMLLTGTKWQIIELLSKESLSPLEIAKKLNTTIANISQQLRLLHTAGLVDKARTGSGKPGKPRTLFSIAHDFAVITLVIKGQTQKKIIQLTESQKNSIKNLLK